MTASIGGPQMQLTPELREELRGKSVTEIEYLKDECRHNLYFLGKGVLHYDQITWDTHAEYIAFIQYCEAKRRLSLMPRGHLKSTINTICDSIRLSLCDPDNTRLLIVNEVMTNSRNFLDEIKTQWENNEFLRFLFPELIPPKLVGPGSDWSQDRASINRRAVYKEATWTAMGLGGSAQSMHFNRIKPDDLIGLKHKESSAEMQAAINWNRGIESLLDSPDKDIIDWTGTRKTISDLYQEVMDSYKDELAVFVREPIENGQPIFPLKYSLKRFKWLMENRPQEWAHDYMNNPVGEGATEWTQDMVQTFVFGEDSRGRFVWFAHRLTRQLTKWYISDLDVVITVDPNGGEKLAPDKAAVVVHGVSPEDDIFILKAQDGRPSPEGLITWIFDAAREFKPRRIGIEKGGTQNTKFWFTKKCDEEGESYGSLVDDLSHHNQEKAKRIRTALDTPLRDRKIFMLPDELTLRQQIAFFPQLALHNWDKLDALANGPELYTRASPSKPAEQEKRREVVARVISLRGRSGYGRSFSRN